MVEYLSVSHLTKYLKLKFDRDPYLEKVYLTGQVSNFRKRLAINIFRSRMTRQSSKRPCGQASIRIWALSLKRE